MAHQDEHDPSDPNPHEKLHPDEKSFEPTEAEKLVVELAGLSPLAYETRRVMAAQKLNVRVGILDKEVASLRPRAATEPAKEMFEPVEPWDQPVNGADLLDKIVAIILRYCVLPGHAAPLIACWILHAWAHSAAQISPLLAIISPEKGCGKTTVLSVIGAMVPKPVQSANITAAALFRFIDKYEPTLLIDEADTFLSANSDLHGIINGGHTREGAYVVRCVGDDHVPTRISTWGAKVIAMIGRLPDTLEDRSIVVPLRRKTVDEKVDWFPADGQAGLLHIRRQALRWATDNGLVLRNAKPDIPSELANREQDNARPICAVADAAGGEWGSLIRSSFLGRKDLMDQDPQSNGVLLLQDVMAILTREPGGRLGSSVLCMALCALEESPWVEHRGGRPLTAHGLVKLLKPFGIRPQRDRTGSYYSRNDFMEAYKRYVPTASSGSATAATTATEEPQVGWKSTKWTDFNDA